MAIGPGMDRTQNAIASLVMIGTLTTRSPRPIAIGPESVSRIRNRHKIQCLLCASESGAKSTEAVEVEEHGRREVCKGADSPAIRARISSSVAVRHNVVIFGAHDRAEAVRRIARLYFRIWPGVPVDVEWLESEGSAMPEACP